MSEDTRLYIAIVLFMPMILFAVIILYVFGVPFLLLGGKKAGRIFDGIMGLIHE